MGPGVKTTPKGRGFDFRFPLKGAKHYQCQGGNGTSFCQRTICYTKG